MPSAPRVRNRRRAPSRPSPLLLAIGAFLQVFGATGGYLHFALVQHEACPEHGEMRHSDADARPSGSWRGGSFQATVLDSASAHDDDHDPCVVVAALSGGVIAEPAVATAGPSDPLGVRPREAPAHLQREILALAPKTSPPPRT